MFEGGGSYDPESAEEEPTTSTRVVFPSAKGVIRGVDVGVVRMMLESTWSTKVNTDNQNKVESLQKKLQNLELEYEAKQEEYEELKTDMKEQGVDLKLQSAQVIDYQK